MLTLTGEPPQRWRASARRLTLTTKRGLPASAITATSASALPAPDSTLADSRKQQHGDRGDTGDTTDPTETHARTPGIVACRPFAALTEFTTLSRFVAAWARRSTWRQRHTSTGRFAPPVQRRHHHVTAAHEVVDHGIAQPRLLDSLGCLPLAVDPTDDRMAREMNNRFRQSLHPEHEQAVARRQANPLPPLFDIAEEVLRYVHEELRCCYQVGLDHAAILTASALVERSLKVAIVCDIFDETGFDPKLVDEVEGKNLETAAKWAKRRGLLGKDEWRYVDDFREHVRNCWTHGGTAQTLKDFHVPIVIGNLKTDEVSSKVVRVGDVPFLRQHGQVFADAKYVDSVVYLAHTLAVVLSATVAAKASFRKLERDKCYTQDDHQRCINNLEQELDKMGFTVHPPADVDGTETGATGNAEQDPKTPATPPP